LVKLHPELTDRQISKLVGTTKTTITAIRERTHWNISNIQPVDPVALGLTKQSELDAAVQAAADRKAKEGQIMSDDERRKLVSTEQSLTMSTEPKFPTAIERLESFSLGGSAGKLDVDKPRKNAIAEAEKVFQRPKDGMEE